MSPSARPLSVEGAVSGLHAATLLLCYLLPRTCTSSSSRATTCCIAAGQMHRFLSLADPSECVGSFHSPLPSPPFCAYCPISCANRVCTSPRALSVWSAHALFLPRHKATNPGTPRAYNYPSCPPPALFPLFLPTTLFLACVSLFVYLACLRRFLIFLFLILCSRFRRHIPSCKLQPSIHAMPRHAMPRHAMPYALFAWLSPGFIRPSSGRRSNPGVRYLALAQGIRKLDETGARMLPRWPPRSLKLVTELLSARRLACFSTLHLHSLHP